MTTINNEVERGKALMIARPQHEHVDLGLPDNDNDRTEDLRRSTSDLRRTHCTTTKFSTTARVEMAHAQVAQPSKAVNDGGPRRPRVLQEWTRRVEAQPPVRAPESRPAHAFPSQEDSNAYSRFQRIRARRAAL